MTWGFIWLMFVLKIPIFGLFGIVWWAVRKSDEPSEEHPVLPATPPHPRSRIPRGRRPRGPHGDPMPLPPERVRTVTAIGHDAAEHAPDR